MKVSTKGQVTIPIELRERLGLHPGTTIEFELDGDAVRLRKADGRNEDWRAYLQRISGSATIKMSTDEIMELTRGE